MNRYQNMFAQKILHRTSLAFDGYQRESELNLPFLLMGPFGTGKTVTLAHTIKKICSTFSDSRILAVAPSQSAADTLAMKLLHTGMDQKSIFRFNSPLRDLVGAPMDISKISFTTDDSFSLPPNLLQFSVVICSAYEAQLLLYWGYSNSDYIAGQQALIDDFNEQLNLWNLPNYESKLKTHWTHLIGI